VVEAAAAAASCLGEVELCLEQQQLDWDLGILENSCAPVIVGGGT
jgi:hypothetical protein